MLVLYWLLKSLFLNWGECDGHAEMSHRKTWFVFILSRSSTISKTSYSTTTFTSSYSIRDKLLSSFTVKLAASVTSTRPHLSTASRIDPLNMSIFALRRITVEPSFIKSTENVMPQQNVQHQNKTLLTQRHETIYYLQIKHFKSSLKYFFTCLFNLKFLHKSILKLFFLNMEFIWTFTWNTTRQMTKQECLRKEHNTTLRCLEGMVTEFRWDREKWGEHANFATMIQRREKVTAW